MKSTMEISLEVHQQRCLSTGDRELHAILTVAARRSADAGVPVSGAGPPRLAEVIVIDCSGSMADPATKIAAARRATAAAIAVLPDGVQFAVVEGTHEARMIYPVEPCLTGATAVTREQARNAVLALEAAGGTAFGPWLVRARELLATCPSASRHVLLLTDGRDEHETPAELERVLAECEGRFVCDARGIGDGWEPAELMRIATVLRGNADAVRQPAELEGDFRETIRAAMGKVLPELRLQISTVAPARLLFCKQVHPTTSELIGAGSRPDGGPVEFSIGSWGEESRDFHLCFEVDSAGRPRSEDLRVARLDVVTDDGPRAAPGIVLVHWSDDPIAVSRPNLMVSHYTGQEELSRAVVDGCTAYDRGDRQGAHGHWGTAVRLATASGNRKVLERLQALVEIIDGPGGVVRLRQDLARIDRLRAQTGSSFTARGGDQRPAPPPTGAVAARTCGCDWTPAPGDLFCVICGKPLQVGTGDAAAPDEPAGSERR